jgi:hypothetical protein
MPRLILPLLLALALALGLGPQTTLSKELPTYRQWISDMKEQPRGPFTRLRWFCNDGSVLPPQPYACKEYGGGHQHGEWSERTVELRAQGYHIANLLAGIDPADAAGQPGFGDRYAQLLIERYLIGADDGWILRKALFYRGAIQEEDEREGARALLEYLAAQPEWIGTRYPALRIGVRLLPHGQETASAQKVRQESAALSDKDPGFLQLRAKIHGAPDAGDADRVRDYAAGVGDAELKSRYQALARLIDGVYQGQPLTEVLEANSKALSGAPWLQAMLGDAVAALRADDAAASRYRVTAGLLAQLRDALARIHAPAARLRVLDLSLRVEDANFRAGAELREAVAGMNRARRIELLKAAGEAAYGCGLIKARERTALQQALGALSGSEVTLERYLDELRYLGRVPGWATQNLRFLFFESMQKLDEIEPRAMLFIQDQLRGSPLLFYSGVLDGLSQDGNRLAGVRHKVFGAEIGTGFHALNPGIAVGVFHARPDLGRMEEFDPKGIYLLPETVSDLPPIAGILTAGEGNPLSHVQLLARNLGIPNVSVNEDLISRLEAHDGEQVVLAVSPAGLVELAALDARWAKILGEDGMASDVVIRPDLKKLDLSAREFISLDELRAADSGRTVGPKAAKLGELRRAFPESVAPGVAIPFGIFKAEVLDRPYRDSGQSIYDWMVGQYRDLAALPADAPERAARTEAFRAELYDLILATRHSEKFREQLRAAMVATFGSADSGVFVRSDTNVEDLPGFTGAGLNLTLPNVVGYEQLLAAINRVWASPFTARAFAWRQSHMESPEHVYTSILLLGSVASDKSGVLVTQDLDTGDRQVISVAVNEGVGGAVDGQAAESLRVDTRDGAVRVTATATAPWRRRPADSGGIEKLPASGSDTVLQPAEIERLIVFARDALPKRFPPITDDAGRPAAADVEFGFVDGQLRLFQIRPFLESRSARGNSYLVAMDQALASAMDRSVKLGEVPGQ